MLGRIRVVIAEGFARIRRTPPFERTRDVVAVSFQHAPLRKHSEPWRCVQGLTNGALDVLEYSAIAWPNAGMWAQAQARPSYAAPPSSARYHHKNDEKAHSHSPNRQIGSRRSSHSNVPTPANTQWQTKTMPPPAMPWSPSTQANLEAIADPFVDLQFQGQRPTQPRWKKESSIDDVSMPDYRSQTTDSNSSRAISGMTGVSYEQKPQTVAPDVDDAAIAELVEALSPLKGTHAPSNSPSGDQSRNSVLSRPSAAAEARSASYSASIRSKKEGKDKENFSSTKNSRMPSNISSASQSRVELLKGIIDEPTSEGKRKRSAASSTPEGRKLSSDNRSISPSAAAAAGAAAAKTASSSNIEKTYSPTTEQPGSSWNTLQVPTTTISLELE